MSYKLVRAEHPSGGSSTMTETRAKALGLKYKTEGAIGRNGQPLAPTAATAEAKTKAASSSKSSAADKTEGATR